MNIEVGQYVLLEGGCNYKGSIIETKVEKVGRKYFYVRGMKFDIKTLRQKTDYADDYFVWFSKEEFENEKEREILYSDLRNTFNYRFYDNELTLNQLRKIKKIVGEKYE